MSVRAQLVDARHVAVQNITTIISGVMFGAMVIAYVSLYTGRLGRLPDAFDVTTIVNTALPLVLVGLGQTVVVMTRGIDLSVGGIMSLAGALAATRMDSTADVFVIGLLVIVVGCLAGAVNGFLIGHLRLAPILVTLGTMSVFNGLAILTLPEPGGSVPKSITTVLANPSVPLGLAYIVLVLVVWFVLRRTMLGVSLAAVGNDESAAAAHGIPIKRTVFMAYVLSGGFSALAGLVLVAKTSAGDPLAGNPYALTSIAAVFLGGASLVGGRASAVGTVFGALTLTLITSVLFFAEIDPLYRAFYEGLLLVLAVGFGLAMAALTRSRREKAQR